jgi:ketosteroid isomerase-like protein
MMDLYDANVIVYDISSPLEFRGKESYRKACKAFLDSYEGPVALEIKDPVIGFSGGLAYSFTLERYTGTLKSGGKSDVWVRVTHIFQKVGAKWKVIHEHVSVPTDFETGKSMLELKP